MMSGAPAPGAMGRSEGSTSSGMHRVMRLVPGLVSPPVHRAARVRARAVLLPALLLPPLLAAGCGGPRPLPEGWFEPPQPYYRTAWPAHDVSGQLASAFRSVKQVIYTAEYRTWVYPESLGITEDRFLGDTIPGGYIQSYAESRAKSGTATVVARSGRRVTLLTSHHVVHFPEVELTFHEDPSGRPADRSRPRTVASVSYRLSELGGLREHPELGGFRVLARDPAEDVAFLGMEIPEGWNGDLPAVGIRAGDPRRLSWGSFLYVLGYPNGYRMVTRGIVSDPNRDRRGGFLTDGLWNEGISGGLVVAIRGDGGTMEWVGVARAGAAEPELRILPDTLDLPAEAEFYRAYSGPLFVESRLRIRYGITLSVSATVIREFLARSRDQIRTQGFPIPVI